MSIQADVSIPAGDFLLGDSLHAESDLQVQMEQMVPASYGLSPYLTVSNGHGNDIDRVLTEDSDIDAHEMIGSNGNTARMQVEWTSNSITLIDRLRESEAVITRASSQGETWSLHLQFPNREQLSTFYRRCTDDGISVTLEGIHSDGPAGGSGHALTDPQKEALETAFASGYFEVPRRMSLVELGDELGISDSAASQRLRRGLHTLLAPITEDGELTP